MILTLAIENILATVIFWFRDVNDMDTIFGNIFPDTNIQWPTNFWHQYRLIVVSKNYLDFFLLDAVTEGPST